MIARAHTGWSLTEIRNLSPRERQYLIKEALTWMERIRDDAS